MRQLGVKTASMRRYGGEDVDDSVASSCGTSAARQSTIKVQCPLLNVNLLNEQCTIATSKGQCSMHRVQEQGANFYFQFQQPTVNWQRSREPLIGAPLPI